MILFQYICYDNLQNKQQYHNTTTEIALEGGHDLSISCVFMFSFVSIPLLRFIFDNLLCHCCLYIITMRPLQL